jgi:hypothetical protein
VALFAASIPCADAIDKGSIRPPRWIAICRSLWAIGCFLIDARRRFYKAGKVKRITLREL